MREDNQTPSEELADSPESAGPAQDHQAEHPAKRAGWRHPIMWLKASKRRLVAAGVVALLVAAAGAAAATDLRYSAYGWVFHPTLNVTVTDSISKQPVPKAVVEVGGASGTTDTNGKATLKRVTAGNQKLVVKKSGYRDDAQQVLVRFVRPSLSVSATPNGIRVGVTVTNLVTGGAVQGVEVTAGEASAISDSEGKADLSLPLDTNNTEQTLKLKKDGYNEGEQKVKVATGVTSAAKLTPQGKVVFQSNRNGRIDIYQSNLDGTKAEVILPATGNEDSQTGILPSIADSHLVALVSSREGRRGGTLHHDLFLFNTETRVLKRIDQDVEFFNFRTWIGTTLVYQRPTADGCSDIKAYDAVGGRGFTLSAGTLDKGCGNILVSLKDGVLFTITNSPDSARNGYYVASLNGSTKRIGGPGAQTAVRRAKQTLLAEYYTYSYSGTTTTWDSINLGTLSVTRVPNGPSDESSRYYNDSPDGSASVFIEERDGKTELYLTDGSGNNEKKLTQMASVNQFVQWYANEYIVFSSTTNTENALYIISKNGGTPVKIADFYKANSRTYGGGGNPYN